MSRRVLPQTTLQQTFGDIRADYDAATINRFRRQITGINPMGGNADYHVRTESSYFKMMELFRYFDRNSPIVSQGITRLSSNVIQQGIGADPRTGDAKIDKIIADKWYDWCNDRDRCDVSKRHDFLGLTKLMFRHQLVDGDVVGILLKGQRIQLVEGHRLRTPSNTKLSVVHGVMMNELREPLEYWFAKDDISPTSSFTRVADAIRIRARDADGMRQVLHVMDSKRISQTRGVSCMAPITDSISMLDDINFAKLVQQQIVSCFTIIREREAAGSMAAAPGYGATTTETTAAGTRTLEGIGPGMEIIGANGEKITGFSPNIPNAEYFDQAMLILTFIAINLDLPVAVLLLDPSKTNFSSWRGAIEQARTRWKAIQREILIAQWYAPIYSWWLRNELATDPVLARAAETLPDFFYCDWTPPYFPYIDPQKDAESDKLIIEAGLNSRRAVLASHGLDVREIDEARIEDQERLFAMCIEAAKRINTKYPEAAVTWREFIAPAITPIAAPVEPDAEPEDGEDEGGEPSEAEEGADDE